MASRARFGFQDPELVPELLLPRRLWRDHGSNFRVGGHSILRLPRARRERPAYLAGREWLDRATSSRTRRSLRAHRPDGAPNFAAENKDQRLRWGYGVSG